MSNDFLTGLKKMQEQMKRGPSSRRMRRTSKKLKEIVLAISVMCGIGAAGHTILWGAAHGDSSADRARREELNRRHETDPSWQEIDEPDTEISKEDWNDYLRGLAFILAPALLMTCIYIGHKALIARQEKRENNAIYVAAQRRKQALSEIGAELEIDERQMQKLIKLVPEMIEEMPDEQAVWLQMLIEGNVEIADNPEFKKMATTVLQNYLASHPQVIEQLVAKIDMDNTHSEVQGYTTLNNGNEIGR